jgi:ATP-binding protein involved in chromosome partitioning
MTQPAPTTGSIAASGAAQGPTEDALRAALRLVIDPATGRDIVTAGLVEAIQIRGGLVQVAIAASRATAAAMEPVRREVEQILAREPGVANIAAVLTSHSPTPAPAQPSGHGHGHGPAAPRAKLLPEVGAVVAVASGKGGVGKSTVAVNLAVSLARAGLRVGLLDADIYGPSLPRMLGVARRPDIQGDRIIPMQAWGLKAMSIGFLIDEEAPMVWRGPMVSGALEQLLGQVIWGPLDIMIIDMPPGTGDAQLTLAQRVSLAGAVIVSTPQDIALIDARRGVKMFEKTRVPILGLVENMSFFHCPSCGARAEIFGHGGARAEARRLGVDFLGEVPLLLDIRTNSDAGTPISAAAPESDAAKAFASIAAGLQAKLSRQEAGAGPKIVIS